MALLGNAASGNQILAQDLLAGVVAQSYLISGTTPGTSATLTLTYGVQEAVVNNGTLAQYVKLAAGTLAITASKDTYVDLGYSGSYSGGAANGTLTKLEVANGAAAPAVTANSLRLWKVVSSGTAITAVTLLATSAPVAGSMLARGVRQIVPYQPSSDLTTDSSHQSTPYSTYANWGHLADVPITTTTGSSILALSVGTAFNYHPTTGNWWRAALALDGAAVNDTAGQVSTTTANSAYGTPSVCLGLWTGVSAGAHNVNLLGASGGGVGLNPAGGYKVPSGATDSGLSVIVVEFA